jgi:hypothetical protein
MRWFEVVHKDVMVVKRGDEAARGERIWPEVSSRNMALNGWVQPLALLRLKRVGRYFVLSVTNIDAN